MNRMATFETDLKLSSQTIFQKISILSIILWSILKYYLFKYETFNEDIKGNAVIIRYITGHKFSFPYMAKLFSNISGGRLSNWHVLKY